jgi:hypothetical protein
MGNDNIRSLAKDDYCATCLALEHAWSMVDSKTPHLHRASCIDGEVLATAHCIP